MSYPVSLWDRLNAELDASSSDSVTEALSRTCAHRHMLTDEL